jgi:hypothetical protein
LAKGSFENRAILCGDSLSAGERAGERGKQFPNTRHRRLNKDIIHPADTEFFELL